MAAWGSVSAEADGKGLCCSVVGNALGKCQLVVDTEHVKVLRGCVPGDGVEAPSLPTTPCLAILISSTWVLLSIIIVVIQLLSHIQLFSTPRTAACQAPLFSTVSQSLLKFMFLGEINLCTRFLSVTIRIVDAETLTVLLLHLWQNSDFVKFCIFSV